jgi:hypothetical protein
MKTQNYLRLSQIKRHFQMHQKSNHCLLYIYMNDFDTVELHLFSVVTLKLDSVNHEGL